MNPTDALDPRTDTPLDLGFDYAGLLAQLRRHGFDAEGLERLTGEKDAGQVLTFSLLPLRYRMPAKEPLTTLFRLFRLGETVPLEDLAAAVAPFTPRQLADAGLVAMSDAGVATPFDLRFLEGIYCFNDRRTADDVPNYVLGINPTAVVLASLTPRHPVGRTLDLGTGCGIQALLAARHSALVVGTDINRRALHLAQVNAKLNGMTNVEFRYGSWFEPVVNETFDLIVCNPPFVISPENRFVFRDSGFKADGVSAMVAQTMAQHLNEGGFGVEVCNWAYDPAGDWTTPLQNWFAQRAVDVIALKGDASTPLDYALHWLRPHYSSADQDQMDAAVARWLAYFEEHGIKGIAIGGLVQRKRAKGPHGFVAYDVPQKGHTSCGDQLMHFFRMQDFVRLHPSDADLQAYAYRPRPGHILEQSMQATDQGYAMREVSMRHAQGLSLPEPFDPERWALWNQFDGRTALGQIVARIAEQANVPLDRFGAACTAAVRRWVLRGYLEPVIG